jgi:hypothetical protein
MAEALLSSEVIVKSYAFLALMLFQIVVAPEAILALI